MWNSFLTYCRRYFCAYIHMNFKMLPLVSNVKVRNLFLSCGRLMLMCTKCRPIVHPILLRNVSYEGQMNSIIRRQLHLEPSELSSGRILKAQHSWDRVPKDFTVVYESTLKNWIWGFYCAQTTAYSLGVWQMWYLLPRIFVAMPDENIWLTLGCVCFILITSSVATACLRLFYIRIYHNSQSGQFVAIRRSCFGRLKQIHYTLNDISLTTTPDSAAMMKIKGKRVVLFSHHFVSPLYYNMHLRAQGLRGFGDTYAQGPKF